MSITSPIPDHNGVVWTALGRVCFFCDAALSDPAVSWSGATGDVYLHPACVSAWFVKLARDVHEIENPEFYRRLRAGQS